jgi:hypothetical protein
MARSKNIFHNLSGYRVISNEAGRCKGIFLTVPDRIEQTSPLAHESRLFLEFLLSAFTLSTDTVMLIDAVLPTSHLFDHYRP